MSKRTRSTNRTSQRADQRAKSIEPLLVSFSGLDGSGKSTQMESLQAALLAAGLGVCRLAFWDDVVVGARAREGFVHKVYKSERGIGAPGKPVNRRDKNMRGWHLSVFRHLLYLLDAIHLRRVINHVKKAARKDIERHHLAASDALNHDGYAWTGNRGNNFVEVILLDRYIYDELVNLNLENPLSRLFVRFVLQFAPQPDIAYFLDADPAAARARKPEYSVEFMTQCRESYRKLSKLLGTLTVLPARNLQDTRLAVLKSAECSLHESGRMVYLASGITSAA